VKPSFTEFAGVYPNPVRSGANVVFALARPERVDLAVYDLQGARVRTLESGMLTPGRYQSSWNGRADDGRRLTGGMYFVRFTAGRYAKTLRTLILR
jgi:flagellar hook assembly protein FlgD